MLQKYMAIALSLKVNTQLDSCLNSMPQVYHPETKQRVVVVRATTTYYYTLIRAETWIVEIHNFCTDHGQVCTYEDMIAVPDQNINFICLHSSQYHAVSKS